MKQEQPPKPSEPFISIDKVCGNQTDRLQLIGPSGLALVWFTKDNNELTVGDIKYNFQANQIIFLTEFHKVSFAHFTEARVIRFNRNFYCILDHDSEVGCKGILFFGASNLPTIDIPATETITFENVYTMFVQELETEDNLQLEMLQTMLKRLLILCTRAYKSQTDLKVLNTGQIELVREYNYLVETHYKTLHSVADYADLLHKSPKTLSNVFGKLSSKTPLQYIQDRKLMEAKKLLKHSSKAIKEIAFEIGFEDLQSFSRFFKKQTNIAPKEYRETS